MCTQFSKPCDVNTAVQKFRIHSIYAENTPFHLKIFALCKDLKKLLLNVCQKEKMLHIHTNINLRYKYCNATLIVCKC